MIQLKNFVKQLENLHKEMLSARITQKLKLILALIPLAAAHTFTSQVYAAAGGLQICQRSTTCTVGEFLYDDNYVPITGASCTITTTTPSGASLFNGQAMTGSADGFYRYEFTPPNTDGYYRTQVCCDVSGETMCLDKSFQVEAAAAGNAEAVAAEVWGYSDRTLTSFGDLVSSIWSNSSRSLTSITDVAGNVLNLTGLSTSTTLSGKSSEDLKTIKATVLENRLLLEELVNEPIIETFIEEDDVPDLSVKLKDTSKVLKRLELSGQILGAKVGTLSLKWDKLTLTQVQTEVEELSGVVGGEFDTLDDKTLLGGVNWLEDAWGFPVVTESSDQAKAIRLALADLQQELGLRGKTAVAYREVQRLDRYELVLSKLVGQETDVAQETTLYGKLAQVNGLAKGLNEVNDEAEGFLADWVGVSETDKRKRVAELSTKAENVNQLAKAQALLDTGGWKEVTEKKLKNLVLSVRGIVGANIRMLAAKPGQGFANIWLEEGSIVFKSLVTNPSYRISQEVPLKFYLPPEIGEEDIIEVDSGLTVKYDAERDQQYVEGVFDLSPGETETISVRVEDVWDLAKEELATLRKQAEELARPLEKTAFFAQGVTLKSDIDVSLDKVELWLASASTPEQRIKAHREAQIELAAALEKMDKLQDLVTQAGSAGSMFGFVGGAQALAVWGLIIIMSAGFVFLALYMKVLRDKEAPAAKTKNKSKKRVLKLGKERPGVKGPIFGGKLALPMLFVGFGLVVAIASSVMTLTMTRKNDVQADDGDQEQARETEDDQQVVEAGAEWEVVEEEAVGGLDMVVVDVPQGSRVNLRAEATVDSAVVTKLDEDTSVARLETTGDWVKVVVDPQGEAAEAWVYKSFVVEPDPEEGEVEGEVDEAVGEEAAAEQEEFVPDELRVESKVASVTIGSTPTGWLRVRKAPVSGAEVTKVNPGEVYPVIDEKSGWFEITLDDGRVGWVAGQYVESEAVTE